MVGMAMPLVKGRGAPVARALGLLWFGALLTASLVGALLGAAGTVIQPMLGHRFWWAIIGLMAVMLAAADFGIGSLTTPGIGRQTYSSWWPVLGPSRAWIAWGAHLGLGAATVRATSLYWVVLALAMLEAPAPAGPVIMAAYATGLAFGVGAVLITTNSLGIRSGGPRLLLRMRGPIRAMSGVTLTLFAVVAVVFSFGG
jgi:hypothetical protein